MLRYPGAPTATRTRELPLRRSSHALGPTAAQDSSKAEEDIRCGGQRTRFPRRYVVDFQAALGAAVHYLRTVQAAPELSWHWYQ